MTRRVGWMVCSGYAKVAFKMAGASVSGVSVDKRMVVVFLGGKGAVNTPVECTHEVISGEIVLWNTLGHARADVAMPTVEQD